MGLCHIVVGAAHSTTEGLTSGPSGTKSTGAHLYIYIHRMLTATLTLVVCLSAMVTAGGLASLSTSQKCARLESAIGAYLPNRMVPDMLFGIMGYYVRMDDASIDRFVKSSKLDFLNSRSARHQFACKLAGSNCDVYYGEEAAAKSRQDVANIMGVPKWQVDNWYVTWTSPVLDVGSVRNLDDVVKVTTLLFIWAENSHYPVMPYRINDQTTLKTFGTIKNVMMSKHVHDSLINSPFPLKVSPNRALDKLKSAKSYSELERGVFMEPGSLAAFADEVKANPGYLRQGKANLIGTMQLIKALYDTGIAYFPK